MFVYVHLSERLYETLWFEVEFQSQLFLCFGKLTSYMCHFTLPLWILQTHTLMAPNSQNESSDTDREEYFAQGQLVWGTKPCHRLKLVCNYFKYIYIYIQRMSCSYGDMPPDPDLLNSTGRDGKIFPSTGFLERLKNNQLLLIHLYYFHSNN